MRLEHHRGKAAVACIFAALIFACGRQLPHPPYAPHPSEALVEVRTPPPPMRAEVVPPQPHPDAVWVDGEWTPRGKNWHFRPGAWVIAPAGATYSPWTTARGDDGTLYFAPGTWRDANHQEIKAPPALATATNERSP